MEHQHMATAWFRPLLVDVDCFPPLFVAACTNITIYSLGTFRVKHDSSSTQFFYLLKSRIYREQSLDTDVAVRVRHRRARVFYAILKSGDAKGVLSVVYLLLPYGTLDVVLKVSVRLDRGLQMIDRQLCCLLASQGMCDDDRVLDLLSISG